MTNPEWNNPADLPGLSTPSGQSVTPSAVALTYHTGMAAPQVVAKGRGHLAAEILQRAQESGVYVLSYWRGSIGWKTARQNDLPVILRSVPSIQRCRKTIINNTTRLPDTGQTQYF